jgi:hypothetical protein
MNSAVADEEHNLSGPGRVAAHVTDAHLRYDSSLCWIISFYKVIRLQEA